MKSINNTLIHRDIKPENILICGDQMKITDFGLAKLAIESTRTFTFKGAGTPLYMAPEAWDYSKNTIQMDMYSMGLVFYEIATLNYAYAKMPASYEEAKDMHMYTTIRRPSLVNGDLNPTIDSIICRMTEKRALKRFTNWDELIEAMEKQENRENSFLDKIADRAVASKNTDYIKRTEAENEERRKKKQQENFIKSVRKQFETEILQLIEQYVDKVNQSYAGQDKMRIKYTSDSRFQSTAINCIIESGNGKRVDLDFKIVLENSFQRDVYGNDLWSNQRTVRTERYTPCYCKKTIMLMGEIYNTRNLGYNLLLLKSDDIFGDWILMKNFNNLSFGTPGKERREPFPFSLNELPEEIVKVQSTHLYRSEFVKYDEEEFISIINRLISM
jgi:serine/threonine protein kinase